MKANGRKGPRAGSSLLGLGLAAVLLVAGSGGAWSPPPAAGGQRDPFAPPGTTLVRVEIAHRGVVQELLALGLRPEEGGRDYLLFRVTDQELATLRAGDFPVSVVADELSPAPPGPVIVNPAWTSYTQLTTELQLLAATYPSLTELRSWGQSVQGREIWGLKITRHPTAEEAEPEVRLVGAHHGNERMGVELCRRMAHYLLENYGTDPRVTSLVNTREIWITPMMNPDGVTSVSRYNAHGVDLNRNYGYMWEAGGSSAFSEPETRAIRDMATENWFVLSLSFHTTERIVNSLWNYSPIYSEDDAVVWTLTQAYAAYNSYWAVRGWYWYETHGDCNDWSYGARADQDWTIETPNSGEETVWGQNRDATLYIIEQAGMGLHGVVTDAVTGAPLRARVTVQNNGWPAFTDPAAGDYHKPLLPGTYTVRFAANGHQDRVVPGVLVPAGTTGATLNAALTPGGGRYADRVEIANVSDPNNRYANHTLTMSMLGAPDGKGSSIGVSGNAVVDLGPGSEVRDIAGADLRVVESAEDGTAEGYRIYGGSSYLGPWTQIGTGTGTTTFDLAGTGLTLVRYLRVVDDGGGNPDEAYAGLDLDAIESYGGQVTAVAGSEGAPGAPRLALLGASPNPLAGGAAEIRFVAPAGARTRLEIFDLAGRRVAAVAEGVFDSGVQAARWEGLDEAGRPVAPGLYLARLASGGESAARKILVVR